MCVLELLLWEKIHLHFSYFPEIITLIILLPISEGS